MVTVQFYIMLATGLAAAPCSV